jgi:hypothetical protein
MLMAMSKRKFLILAFIIVFSLCINVQNRTIFAAKGNIYPPYNNDDISDPSVSIISPSNQSYSVSNVQLTFMVTGADSSDIVKYSLDGTIKNSFYGSKTISENLVGLSEGEHAVQIDVYYIGAKLDWSHSVMQEPAEKHQVIQFSVASSLPSPSPSIEPLPSEAPSPSPSPSPTLSPTLEPTVEPTSTPKPSSGFLGTNLPTEYGYAMVAVLVIAVVGLSLVYLRRLRKV